MKEVMEVFLNIGIRDVMDMAIVAFVFYKLFMLIRHTSAEQVLKGLVVLLIATKVSEWSRLYAINWILKKALELGMIAVLIVFQPELRRALEHIGRTKLFTKSIMEMSHEDVNDNIDEIVEAASYLSRQKIGALMIIERETGIEDIIETGTSIQGNVSSGLLINIFIPNTPLHDGAVVIRKDQIMAAGCVLPLTENPNLSKELGTRHRAGIGISERCDAVSIMVSEETGAISVAMDGKLSRYLDGKTLRAVLKNAYKPENNKPLFSWNWRQKHE
ncbi:diadenylate cyclase CdaA [Crassaminicella profunda]|uniref:diadenylate cyclase CdaA n=1 Tax=Crassaminicella profunda TaxID=1286698 RepID=UPI001CA713BD|nr:diadenylate cyclase CdaA [Crassaminicella profunda]QZY55587.1 diadenylate cyclase CdaA [Crassaminicella profunda]